MSCEMIFGQDPPASIDDPALKQPCYRLCNNFYYEITYMHSFTCYTLKVSKASNIGKMKRKVPPNYCTWLETDAIGRQNQM